ncbi:MAG: general stress protein [Isosphaeraceae bacterium]|nr:general stress protein [Isosphaeraceae bacterium]
MVQNARACWRRLCPESSRKCAGPRRRCASTGFPCRTFQNRTNLMRNIVGLFETREEAESAINRLKAQGIATDGIGVAMKDTTKQHNLAEATGAEDLSSEGATAGVVSGAAIGALVGLAVAGATFALPGIGTFLVWGPFASALSGAGIGAASGGILGALIGSGIPEPEAHHYLTGLESGHVVVTASVPDARADDVRVIFNEEGSHRTHVA